MTTSSGRHSSALPFWQRAALPVTPAVVCIALPGDIECMCAHQDSKAKRASARAHLVCAERVGAGGRGGADLVARLESRAARGAAHRLRRRRRERLRALVLRLKDLSIQTARRLP